ncbi:MAG: TIGR03986 family type III CRISPR-associated RAMP protein, partial [Chloroflexota bacterium]
KHSDEIRDDRQAIAPYNFVPLPETVRQVEKPPSQGFYDENLLTGKIHCTLTNSTPIYVRAAQTLAEYEQQSVSPEPFYYGSSQENLLIPGSSIRGMLRTLVEVVSQARLSPITDKQLFYRSVEDTSMGRAYRDRMKDKVRAGFYHENSSGAWITPTIAGRVMRSDITSKWNITNLYENERPASPKRVPLGLLQHKIVYIRLSEKARDNPTRFFTVEEFSRQKLDGLVEALLVITGDMQNKKKEFVFLKQAIDTKIKISDEQVYLFEDKDQLTQYQKFAFPHGRRGKGTLKNGDPVFYLIGEDEGKVVGFGRAYMFRLPYQLSPSQLVAEELTGDTERYDMAESIFGYVPQDKTGRKQVASRVSILDAIMQGNPKEAVLKQTQLKILSSPKPTSFQHYLTQTKPNDPNNLFHYDTPITQTTLRGHKFYWHKGPIQPDDYTAVEQGSRDHDSQYSPPIKPIREGQTFTFEIHFENLRPEELGALLWVLDKAGNDQYRLKLGMGKPYGLGSVAISAAPQLEDCQARYQKLISLEKWHSQTIESAAQKCNEARVAFARWVLKRQDATPDQVDLQERIQELLIMLSWREVPDKKETRYMELKEYVGKMGKYKTKRPVLPSPHVVFGKWLKSSAKMSTSDSLIPSGYERGVVKEFGLGSSQSYGFITRSNGADLFVHRNAFSPGLNDLQPGQKVIFKLVKGPKGPQAQDVKLEE